MQTASSQSTSETTLPKASLEPSFKLLPLAELIEILKKHANFPYASSFSVLPCIEAYNKHVSKKAQLDPKEWGHVQDRDEFEDFLRIVMPSMFYEGKHTSLSMPFSMEFKYDTKEFDGYFNQELWQYKQEELEEKLPQQNSKDIVAAGILILNQLYDQDIELPYKHIVTLVNVPNGLEYFFEMKMNGQFIKVIPKKPLPKIDKFVIRDLLQNLDNPEKWLEVFPPGHFEFTGFHMVEKRDVTDDQVVSKLKSRFLLDEQDMDPRLYREVTQRHIRSYLRIPNLEIGFIGIDIGIGENFPERNMSLIENTGFRWKPFFNQGIGDGPYHTVYQTGEPVIISDLENEKTLSLPVELLINRGIKSLIIIPTKGEDGKLNGMIEFGCNQDNAFNSLTVFKLEELVYLFEISNQKFLRDIQNRTTRFIQKQFTSIHPSVEWKFNEVAFDHEVRATLPDFDGQISPIILNDLHPLYGQADIVGSSNKRNAAIQEDLVENLQLAESLIQGWLDNEQHYLLELYLGRVASFREDIETSFVSSEESEIIEFLKGDLHPLLKKLAYEDSAYPQSDYTAYTQSLDEELGIVYNHRKEYEQSVTQLNMAISELVEKEDDRMQGVLPHYFEKYKTDGIEYNLYLGKSILRTGTFGDHDLKNFRIWQLELMASVTRLSTAIAEKLPVRLETAQLIFIYNNKLDLRFRLDEKQFDVDGAYNVRYEILKKRIDKATVKGTSERLTLAGKIALVYLQDKDKQEYLEYLKFLISKGILEPEIEDLELNKLQGAEGLKALRVTPKSLFEPA